MQITKMCQVNFRCGGSAIVTDVRSISYGEKSDVVLSFNNGSVQHVYTHDGLIRQGSAVFDIVSVG